MSDSTRTVVLLIAVSIVAGAGALKIANAFASLAVALPQ